MLLTSTRICVLTGAALLAGGIAFADAGIPALEFSGALKSALLHDAAAPKGDRLAPSRPALNPTGASIVEIVGLNHATIILRDGNGKVIFRSDPRSGMTTISKNTEFPILTVKDGAERPTIQETPRTTREENEETGKIKRRNPIGCVGDVSPLASAASGRMPSLCLARLEQVLA